MDFFLKVDLIGCFRELHVRKFRKFSPDHFYDLKNRFYDKKQILGRKQESMASETTRESMASETTWVYSGERSAPIAAQSAAIGALRGGQVVSLEITDSQLTRDVRYARAGPFVEIRTTGNPLLRREVAGCRQAWPGRPGQKNLIVLKSIEKNRHRCRPN